MPETIPPHWEDVSAKGKSGEAYRRTDGRSRIEMSHCGVYVASVPNAVFPVRQDEGTTLVEFMVEIDAQDVPRIPHEFMFPHPPLRDVIDDEPIVCPAGGCRWRFRCVASNVFNHEPKLVPDLQASLSRPTPRLGKPLTVSVTCRSYKQEEDAGEEWREEHRDEVPRV